MLLTDYPSHLAYIPRVYFRTAFLLVDKNYGILLVAQTLHHQLMLTQQNVERQKVEKAMYALTGTVEYEFLQWIRNTKTPK